MSRPPTSLPPTPCTDNFLLPAFFDGVRARISHDGPTDQPRISQPVTGARGACTGRGAVLRSGSTNYAKQVGYQRVKRCSSLR